MSDDNVIQMPANKVLVGADGQPIRSDTKTEETPDDLVTMDLMDLYGIPYLNVRTMEGTDYANIGLLVTDGPPDDPKTTGKVFNIRFTDASQFQAAVLTLKALGKVTEAALGNGEDPPPRKAG